MEDGRPASVIAQVADSVDANVIAVGRRGRGGVAELVLGSVSHELVLHAKRPVLLIPAVRTTSTRMGPSGPDAGATRPSPGTFSRTYAALMKHILLAIDRGAPSWEATRMAIHIAPRLKAPVTVFSIVVTKASEAGHKGQAAQDYEAARELVDDVVNDLIRAGRRQRRCPHLPASEVAGRSWARRPARTT